MVLIAEDTAARPHATTRLRSIDARFNVLVREGGSGAELTVNTAMRATSWDTMNGMPREVVQCISTGVLEREIHDEVMGRVVSGTRG